jgi:glycine/D-amino acid oxidase-like deaminating enzyme
MSATKEGLTIQKSLAKSLDQHAGDLVKELGSFYVGYQDDEEGLRLEYDFFLSLGACCADLQWYDREKLQRVEGCPSSFHCAIFFPADAIIDSSSYAKLLLRQFNATIMMNTRVVDVADHAADGAVVKLDTGVTLKTKHVVMATGGLYQVPRLNGLISPCYSYLVHVPTGDVSCDVSSNFFTWGFSHDWCFTNGKVRTSGEDHFSAYKAPKVKERCANLIEWTRQQYDCKEGIEPDSVAQQYGVYSDTPDYVPLVGTLQDESAICYLLGCNAWGQTILSYASSLVPGILGYEPMSESQRDNLNLFTIRRFTRLPQL